MGVMRNLQIFKITAVLLALFLAGCNSGEDFSEGTSVQGSLIAGGTSDPLDPDQEALEIELVAGVQTPAGVRSAVVTNIGYTCGNIDFYVPVAEPGAPGNSRGLPQHIARCPLDSDTISFFIGRRPIEFGKRFYIGSARLPRCSGRNSAECGASAGFFQVAVADLVNTPERTPSADKAVSTRAALLAVLDGNHSDNSGDPADDVYLEIPNAAHNVTSAEFDAVVPLTSSGQRFDAADYANYAAFVSAWDSWRTAVSDEVDDAIAAMEDLDPTPAWPAEGDANSGAIGAAAAASNRARAGLFQLEHNSPANAFYALAFGDENIDYQRLSLVMTALVYPDGDIVGIGSFGGLNLNNEGELDTQSVSNDLAVFNAGSLLDEQLYFGGAPGSTIGLRTLFDYDDPEFGATDLSLSGRLIGGVMYDGLSLDGRVDFDEDYPVDDGEEIYDVTETGNEDDLARLGGTLLGDASFGSPDGLGYKVARTGLIAGGTDAGLIDALPPFYRLTFFKACVLPGDETPPGYVEQTTCDDIPANEIVEDENGDPQNLNYNTLLLGDTDYPNGFPVTEEQRREFVPGDQGDVVVQFLDDGTIVTDRDQDCSAVDPVTLVDGIDGDGEIQEYKVGFVTRTLRDDDSGNRSVGVAIYLVGEADLADDQSPDYIPQYGTLIRGRIDLGTTGSPNTTAPILRLGDTNFDNEVRALWLDQYQSQQLKKEFFDPNLPDNGQVPVLRREFLSLLGGAVQGQAQESDGGGGCTAP